MRLRTCRLRAGLSQVELAAMVGMSQSDISRIENGRTATVNQLLTFAKALNVRPVTLLPRQQKAA